VIIAAGNSTTLLAPHFSIRPIVRPSGAAKHFFDDGATACRRAHAAARSLSDGADGAPGSRGGNQRGAAPQRHLDRRPIFCTIRSSVASSDLTFLYGESVPKCTHHIDKHFVGYNTLQYMS
jgi:hypothetical protein